MRGYQAALAIVLILVMAISSGFAGYSIGKTQARGYMFERFHKLKKEHPEQFRKMMERRRGQIRERLAKLKEKDPEKYKEIIQGQIERMESNLSELKKDLAGFSQDIGTAK